MNARDFAENVVFGLPDRPDDPPWTLVDDTFTCGGTYQGWHCTNLAPDNGIHVARIASGRIVARWRTDPEPIH